MVSGVTRPALGGVRGVSRVKRAGKFALEGCSRAEISVSMLGGMGGKLSVVFSSSFGNTLLSLSGVAAEIPTALSMDPRSGLVLALLSDRPGENASRNLRPGEMPRMELLRLFPRFDLVSEGRLRVLERSMLFEDDEKADVESEMGSEGECVMVGMSEALKEGL